jgi:hypothetical protein
MANQTNGNKFRDDEIIMTPWDRREEKWVNEILLLTPSPPGILTSKINLGV